MKCSSSAKLVIHVKQVQYVLERIRKKNMQCIPDCTKRKAQIVLIND